MSELTYEYGVIEGRLIENEFVPVSDGLFMKRHGKHVFVVQVGKELCNLLMIEDDMEFGVPYELKEYIDHILNQDECYEVFDITGHIHDIITVFKMLRLEESA